MATLLESYGNCFSKNMPLSAADPRAGEYVVFYHC